MSAHHKFKTDILVTIAGVEHEWPAVIVYARQKGYRGDRESPPEDATVEIVSIEAVRCNGDKFRLPSVVEDGFNDDPEIIALLMADWRDDEIAAAEYRAEARAEDRRDDAA